MAVIQSMKAVRQFALDGHWCTAWRFTGIPDPYLKPRCGATPLESEAALGEQKVEDDLRRRSKVVLNGTFKPEEVEDGKPPEGKGLPPITRV